MFLLFLGTCLLIFHPMKGLLLPSLVFCGYLSFVLAELFERGLSNEQNIFISSMAAGILLLLFLGGYSLLYPGKIRRMIRAEISQSLGKIIALYEEKEVQLEQVDWLKKASSHLEGSFFKASPALIVVFLFTLVILNYFVIRYWLQITNFPLEDRRPFWQWRLGDYWVWFFIFSGFIWYVNKFIPSWIGLNIFIVVCFFYFIQGLAVIVYLFQQRQSSWLVSFIGVAFFFLIPGSYLLLILGGLIDTWFDFRKLRGEYRVPVA